MAGQESTTQGGAKLVISHAAFEDGLKLMKAVNRVMLDQKLFGAPATEVALRLLGDGEVYSLFLLCAQKATYNGRKVNSELFSNTDAGDEASKDLIEVFDAVVHFNTSRFFRVASSASKSPLPAA